MKTLNPGVLQKYKSALIIICPCLLIYFYLAPFYGILPIDSINSLGILYSALGKIDCLSNSSFSPVCSNAGAVSGSAINFGLPFAYTASLLKQAVPVSTLTAYNLTGLIFLSAGWAGMYLLIRRLGGSSVFAILGALLFFSLPIVWGKSGYGFLLWGFVLSPFFIWLDLWYFKSQKYFLCMAVILFSKCFLLFMEPYSFVMLSLFTLILFTHEFYLLLKSGNKDYKTYIKFLFIIVSLLIAYLLYRSYIPGGANYGSMPVDFFRGQGIDLLALFNRESGYYAFGHIWNVSIKNPRLFFTDGESVKTVYLGLVFLSVIPLTFIFGKFYKRHALLLFAAGLAGFLLALGPSLKINDRRSPDEIKSSNITFNDYLMPEERAACTMPYGFIYKITPLKFMRSVSRWYLMTMLAFVVLLMVTLTCMWRRGVSGKVFVFIILCLSIFEYTPNYKSRVSSIKSYTKQFHAFNATALEDFRNIVSPGDMVLFLKPGGIGNEYFSTYLCAAAGCRTFNVSGDKALAIAKKQWPAPVIEACKDPDLKHIRNILESGIATIIVLPHFDMRWDSYRWPPKDKTRSDFINSIDSLVKNNGDFEQKQSEWFTALTLK